MWVATLSPDEALSILGEHWQEIVTMTVNLRHGVPLTKPNAMTENEFEDALARFGPNGASVSLFFRGWANMPFPRGPGAAPSGYRIYIPRQEGNRRDNPSALWRSGLDRAGWLASGILSTVWKEGEIQGEAVGGHAFRVITPASAAELAQMPLRDEDFFLSLIPFVRRGYVPSGWDDEASQPLFW